jgi:uncharacterized protein YdbL (DUF1318 family)
MRPIAAMICLLLAVAGAAAPSRVVAQGTLDLSTALRTGIVGERYDGFMGYAAAVPRGVQQQVSAINIRRRALYTALAQRRGVTPQAAGIATGCQTLARIEVGEAYMLPDGVWRQRAAGQAAPRPAYCG